MLLLLGCALLLLMLLLLMHFINLLTDGCDLPSVILVAHDPSLYPIGSIRFRQYLTYYCCRFIRRDYCL